MTVLISDPRIEEHISSKHIKSRSVERQSADRGRQCSRKGRPDVVERMTRMFLPLASMDISRRAVLLKTGTSRLHLVGRGRRFCEMQPGDSRHTLARPLRTERQEYRDVTRPSLPSLRHERAAALTVTDLKSQWTSVSGCSSQNFASAPDGSSLIISQLVTSTIANSVFSGTPAAYWGALSFVTLSHIMFHAAANMKPLSRTASFRTRHRKAALLAPSRRKSSILT